jgi:site-specific DNA-methyltransferase (adenine-specific)
MIKPKIMNKVHHLNFLDNDLPDKCAKLIIADSPYFQVKGDFDFIWNTRDEFLADVEKWAIECKRILADNGTIFWYGSAKGIAYVQIILDKYFNLVNNLVWEKKECQTRKNKKEDQRSFIPVTERILMYDNGNDMSGSERIDNDITLFMPIKKYFDEWLDKSGLTLKEATERIGSSCTHWFGFSKREKCQFSFPTIDKWKIMESIFPNRRDYEELRRYFKLSDNFKFDVLLASQESHLTKEYDHETKKPETLTRALILTCSRPNDLVVVPFAGSGTECAMAAKEGRNFIGFDIDKKHVNTSNRRCFEILRSPQLF